MSSQPVKNGRGVLAELPNGIETSSSTAASKKPGTIPRAVKAGETAPPNSKIAYIVSQQRRTSAADTSPSTRRPSQTNANKRGRPSPHMKRVSFGGDTIKIFNQHNSELVSPDALASQDSSPPRKAVKDAHPSSPSAHRSPLFAPQNPDLNLSDEDGHDDTVTVPDASKLTASIPMDLSPPQSDGRSTPVPVRRDSVATRESFGIFLDDEVTKGAGDINDGDDTDKTVLHGNLEGTDLPSLDSPGSGTSDGDVTQNLSSVLHLVGDDLASADDEIGLRNATHRNDLGKATISNRRLSSRKSLAYMGSSKGADPIGGGILRTKRDRCSMMPLLGNDDLRADKDTLYKPSPNDSTIHVPHLDSFEYSEEEEDISEPALTTANAPVRQILPDNRQLFDSGEDPTIHFYDDGHVADTHNKSQTGSEPRLKENSQQHSSGRDSGMGLAQDNSSQSVPITLPTNSKSIMKSLSPHQTSNRESDHPSKRIDDVSRAYSGKLTPTKSILKNVNPHYPGHVESEESSIRPTEGMRGLRPSVAKSSTPLSATGSAVRALKEKASGSRKQAADSHLRKLSDSVPKSSRRCERGEQIPSEASTFGIAEFLETGKIHFDDKIGLDLRKPSLAPVPSSLEVDRSSLEWKILESVKKSKILTRLQDEVAKHLDMVKSTTENISALENSIVRSRPPVFSKLSRVGSLGTNELGNTQIGLKRLQKLTARQVRLDWVLSRQQWEGAIREDLEAATASGRKDVTELEDSERTFVRLRSELENSSNKFGLARGIDADELDDTDSAAENRKQVEQEFSFIRDLRNLMLSERTSEKEYAERKEALIPKRDKLLASQKHLQTYAGAGTDKKLNALMTERIELNTILCDVAGLRPSHISGDGIGVTIAEMMELYLELKEDAIGEATAKPVVIYQEPGSVLQKFVEGAVSLASCYVKTLASVRDIPFALYSCARALFCAKNCVREAIQYFDGHLGEISGVAVTEGESSSVDLTIVASFYSLELRVKFDLSITISTFFPKPTIRGPFQEVKTVTVTRFIGNSPPDERLQQVLMTSGFRKDPDTFCLLDAMSAIWSVLSTSTNQLPACE